MLCTFNVDLAVLSAFSLPVMPMWLGIQQRSYSCFYSMYGSKYT